MGAYSHHHKLTKAWFQATVFIKTAPMCQLDKPSYPMDGSSVEIMLEHCSCSDCFHRTVEARRTPYFRR